MKAEVYGPGYIAVTCNSGMRGCVSSWHTSETQPFAVQVNVIIIILGSLATTSIEDETIDGYRLWCTTMDHMIFLGGSDFIAATGIYCLCG